MADLIPADQLFTKLSSGTAFQADAVKSTLDLHVGSLTGSSSSFFSNTPGSPSFPTIKPEFTLLPQASLLTSLGGQMSSASSGLSSFGSHVDTQLTDMPKNLNILASHNAMQRGSGGSVDCGLKLPSFFGSVLGAGNQVLKGIGDIFKGITTAIAAAGGVLNYIQTQLAAAIAGITQAVGAAVAAVTAFIAAEVKVITDAISDLVHNATSHLFSGLFKDACVSQIMGSPSPSNVLGLGQGLVV